MKLEQSLSIIHQNRSITSICSGCTIFITFSSNALHSNLSLEHISRSSFTILLSGLHTAKNPLLIVLSIQNSQNAELLHSLGSLYSGRKPKLGVGQTSADNHATHYHMTLDMLHVSHYKMRLIIITRIIILWLQEFVRIV